MDRCDDGEVVDVGRQGKLDEDPVYRIVRVKLCNQGKQAILAHLRRQCEMERPHAGCRSLADLTAYVDLAGWIVPDQDDRKTRLNSMARQVRGRSGNAG